MKRKLIFIVAAFASLISIENFNYAQVMNFGTADNPTFSHTSIHEKYKAISPEEEERILEEVTVLMLDNCLTKAKPLIDNLLDIDSANPHYNYLKGFIALYHHKNHENSIIYFTKAISQPEGNLDLLKINTDVTNDVFYHLAQAHHFVNNFDEAERYYTIFLERSMKNSILYDATKIHLVQCTVARKLISNPSKIEVTKIDNTINTESPEYSPIISANGRELYFTSRRQWSMTDQKEYRSPVDNSYPEDIYFSCKNARNEWTSPKILPLCTAFNNEASLSLNSNMNTLYVYSDRVGDGDIFYSKFGQDEFYSMLDVEQEKINTKNWESHFVLSEDSSLIVFTSERKGGFGGRDLWLLNKLEDGSWSKPINAGKNINTASDEDSPFLTLDGSELYYATNGTESMGGFDIMKSTKSNEGDWTKGTNMGYPLNSTGNDIFFSINQTGKDAYFSSFRNDEQLDQDIFHVDFMGDAKSSNVISLGGGIINVTDDAKEIDLEVTLLNITDKNAVGIKVKHGDYFQVLNACKEYELTYINKLDGEILLKETINTNCNSVPEFLEKFYYNGQYWIDGLISAVGTKTPIENATIVLINSKTGEVIGNVNSNNEGSFESSKFSTLVPGDSMNVSFHIKAEGYKETEFALDKLLGTSGRIEVAYELEKEDRLENMDEILASYIIYFDFDKANIRNSENEIMNKVITLMNTNPDIQVRLGAHTDSRGSNTYNQVLSNKRAQSSLRYIQKRITNPDRITAIGMGEKEFAEDCMINGVENCSEEQHQLNRRTGFEIIRR